MRRESEGGEVVEVEEPTGRYSVPGSRLAMGTQQLERLTRAAVGAVRDDELASIIRDLETPLSAITLELQVLDAKTIDPAARRSLAAIRQNVGYVDRLVRELQDQSTIGDGPFELRREPVALRGLLEGVVERAEPERVVLEVRDDVTVLLDIARIERVMANLIHNALASSPAVVVRLEAQGDVAAISVIDHGPALSPDEARGAFDRYRHGRYQQGRDGHRLGLYTSRKIVELHGGRIGVESAKAGSRFFVELPLGAGDPAVAKSPAKSLVRGAYVLVVDDDLQQATALSQLLRDEGVMVAIATASGEALARIAMRRPDIVLLDAELGGVRGVALLELLRDLVPGLPAIVLSDRDRAHVELASTRFVDKPIVFARLLESIEALLAS